jgi:chitinase
MSEFSVEKSRSFMKLKSIAVLLLSFLSLQSLYSQDKPLSIIAYYSGGPERAASIPAEKLTHVIFSFCHLKGNKLTVDNGRDTLAIRNLVGLKKRNPQLKIILSLGGWGGCETCSDVFSTAEGRSEFSQSVLTLNQSFGTDGIDLDWEYPAIEGFPKHRFVPEDLQNFTALVQELRKTLKNDFEISFAAGGFQKFLNESAEWEPVMKVVDRVNVMSYDLINGYATATGHHTALYSTPSQPESTDNAVQYLIKIGVPRNKIVIGAAFYARIWENVPPENNGLYQSGKFKSFTDYSEFPAQLNEKIGYKFYWDNTASAPYAYNAEQKLFATFDDKKSLDLKTKYAIDQKLDGIMFWEITHDLPANELVSTIYNTKKTYVSKKK